MENTQLLGFIFLYLLVTLLIGWWASRKVQSTTDFVLAGRRLPLSMASTAMFATWFGSETVLGASAQFAEHGLIGIIEDPFGAALCLVLASALLVRPLYRLNLLTLNDFFKKRFGVTVERISAVIMIPSYLGWIAAQLVAMAIILQSIGGVDKNTAVLFCGSVVLIYTLIGGMWSVAVTDFVQTIIIIIGLSVLAISTVSKVGGFEKMMSQTPPDFFRFFPKPNTLDWIHWLVAWMTIGFGSIPGQDVFQRVMSAKTERVAFLSCYIGAVLYLSIAFLPIVITFCGRLLYPDLLQYDSQMILPQMVLLHSGWWLQVLFFGALLSAILSTASGALLAPATVLGENLVRPFFKDANDRQLLKIMRISVLSIGSIGITMALLRNNIYELAGEASSFTLVSLFCPLILGIYWKACNATGALAGMVVGLLSWLFFYVVYPTEIPSSLIGFLCSLLAVVVGSKIQSQK